MDVNINRANNSRQNPSAFMVLEYSAPPPHFGKQSRSGISSPDEFLVINTKPINLYAEVGEAVI